MTISPKYQRPPITEAIIDIRVECQPGLSIDAFALMLDRCKADFPIQERLFEAIGKFEVQIGGDATASASNLQTGFKIASADGLFVAQAQLGGFTFSRLSPYESWESFRDEARRIWSIYSETVSPVAFNRQAVRYVNRLDIPGGQAELSQWFRTAPELSPDMAQTMEDFFMQLRIPQADIRGMAIINQATIPAAKEGVVSIVLDIDLFRSEDLALADAGLWDYFEVLHDRKNSIFEASITDSTRRLFS